MAGIYYSSFNGETINALDYDKIDLGNYKVRYYSFKVSDGNLTITRHTGDGGSVTISNWTAKPLVFRSSDYVVKQLIAGTSNISDNTTSQTIYIGDNNENAINATSNKKYVIASLDDNDTIVINGEGNSNGVVVLSGDGNDNITITGGYHMRIDGGSGNDTITVCNQINVQDPNQPDNRKDSHVLGGGGNDTITITDSDYIVIAGDRSFDQGDQLGYSEEFINNGDTSAYDNTVDPGNDTITLINTGHSYILGDAGDDTVILKDSNENIVYAGTGNDTVTNIGSTDNAIYGEVGNDVVTSIGSTNTSIDTGSDKDVIHVLNGVNETIKANSGDDVITLYGGVEQIVSGGTGSDTYRFLSKLKADTLLYIDQSDAGNKDKDRLVLSKVKSNNVTYYGNGRDLYIADNSTGSGIYIKDWDNHVLNSVVFKDKNVSFEEINTEKVKHALERSITLVNGVESADAQINGLEGKDYIKLNNGSQYIIRGLEGDDEIVLAGADGYSNEALGGEGADSIIVNAGTAHLLSGDEGNDTLTVNGGNAHTLSGGVGSDKYVINTVLGTGVSYFVDQVVDPEDIEEGASAGSDTLELSAVNKANVQYTLLDTYTDAGKEVHQNVLKIHDTVNGGDVYVYDWDSKLAQIKYAGGEVATYDDVAATLVNLNVDFNSIADNGSVEYTLAGGEDLAYNINFTDSTSYKDVNYAVDGEDLIITLTENVSESTSPYLASGGLAMLSNSETTVTKTIVLKKYLTTSSQDVVFNDGRTCVYNGGIKRGGNASDGSQAGDAYQYDNMHGYLRYFFVDKDWNINIRDYGANMIFDLSVYSDFVLRYVTEGFSGNNIKMELLSASDGSNIGSIIMENAYDINDYETITAEAIKPNVILNNSIKFNTVPFIDLNEFKPAREYLGSNTKEILLSKNSEVITGNEEKDIIHITGEYNRVNTNSGNDIITITGSNNRVNGNSGRDIYYIDLNITDNTTLGAIDYDNPDYVVMKNIRSSDVLFSYDQINYRMDIINANGNTLSVESWSKEGNGCTFKFEDGELTQEDITYISLHTKKVYELNKEGETTIPSNYTGIKFTGTNWTAVIPKYRQTLELDLSSYSNYITKYVVTGIEAETAKIYVLSAEDRSLIGTIVLQHAYDNDDYITWTAEYIKTNVVQSEGIEYAFKPFTDINEFRPNREYLAANGIEVELPESKEVVTGHEGQDIINIIGSHNRVNTYGGNDIITITGSNNRVSGGSDRDIYYIDLNITDNTTLGAIDYDNPDYVVMKNVRSSDVLFSYDQTNYRMDIINANGNILSVESWSKEGNGCTFKFEDGELTQEDITYISLHTKKVYELNKEGETTIPSNYTGIKFTGTNWTAVIPKYRQTLELDLSSYSNYITKYVITGIENETANIYVLDAKDRSLIGTIVLQHAYDNDDYITWTAEYIKTNVVQSEGIEYAFKPFTDLNEYRPVREYLAASGMEVELPESSEVVTGHQGQDIINIKGDYNRVFTYDGDDIITITGNSNRVNGGGGKDTYIVDLTKVYGAIISDADTDNNVVFQNVKFSEVEFTYNESINSLYMTVGDKFVTVENCNTGYDNYYNFTFNDKTISVKQAIDVANKQYQDDANSLNITISGYYEVADDVTNIIIGGNLDGMGDTIRATINNMDVNKSIDLTAYQKGKFVLSYMYDEDYNRISLLVQKALDDNSVGTVADIRFENASQIVSSNENGFSLAVGNIKYWDQIYGEKNISLLNFDKDGKYIINGTDDAEYINFGGMANVNAGAGDDVITGYYEGDKTIAAGSGNDKINVYGGKNVIINAGDGDDEVTVNGIYDIKQLAVIGGAGDDVINITNAEYSKVAGGVGNDQYVVDYSTIWETVIDSRSDKQDADTLKLNNIKSSDVTLEWFTTTYEGNKDVVCLRIADKTYKDKYVDIMYWNQNKLASIEFDDVKLNVSDIEASLGELVPQEINGAREVIKSFMSSLDNTTQIGFNAMNEAVIACSGGRYTSLEALVTEFKNACMTKSGSSYDEMKAFLLEYCGVNLDNDDTGSIIGKDAGGKKVYTDESIVQEPVGMTSDDWVYDVDSYEIVKAPDYYEDETRPATECYSTQVNGVTFYWNKEKLDAMSAEERAVAEKYIAAVINGWAKPSMDLIQNAIGLKLDSDGTTLNRLLNGERAIQIELENNPGADYLAYVKSRGSYYTDTPTVINRTMEVMVINTAYYDDVLSDVNGASNSGQAYLDRIIAHELTHGVMAANIVQFNNLPLFLTEGMAELVHGIDNFRESTILKLVNTAYSGTEKVLDKNNKEVYEELDQNGLLDAVFNLDREYSPVGEATYAGGYLLLRYMAKQIADSMSYDELISLNMPALFSNALGEDWTSIKSGSVISSKTNRENITGTGYSDIIAVNHSGVSVNAGAGDDIIAVGSDANSVMLTGGAGDDIYRFTDNFTGKQMLINQNSALNNDNDVIILENVDKENVYFAHLDSTRALAEEPISNVLKIKDTVNKGVLYIEGWGESVKEIVFSDNTSVKYDSLVSAFAQTESATLSFVSDSGTVVKTLNYNISTDSEGKYLRVAGVQA